MSFTTFFVNLKELSKLSGYSTIGKDARRWLWDQIEKAPSVLEGIQSLFKDIPGLIALASYDPLRGFSVMKRRGSVLAFLSHRWTDVGGVLNMNMNLLD